MCLKEFYHKLIEEEFALLKIMKCCKLKQSLTQPIVAEIPEIKLFSQLSTNSFKVSTIFSIIDSHLSRTERISNSFSSKSIKPFQRKLEWNLVLAFRNFL